MKKRIDTSRVMDDSCEMCGRQVSPAKELVYYATARDDTLVSYCEACWDQRKAGRRLPDGSVQLSLDHWADQQIKLEGDNVDTP